MKKSGKFEARLDAMHSHLLLFCSVSIWSISTIIQYTTIYIHRVDVSLYCDQIDFQLFVKRSSIRVIFDIENHRFRSTSSNSLNTISFYGLSLWHLRCIKSLLTPDSPSIKIRTFFCKYSPWNWSFSASTKKIFL